jgi:hypothetical protein
LLSWGLSSGGLTSSLLGSCHCKLKSKLIRNIFLTSPTSIPPAQKYWSLKPIALIEQELDRVKKNLMMALKTPGNDGVDLSPA